jgi:Tol biopolymer transport system component
MRFISSCFIFLGIVHFFSQSIYAGDHVHKEKYILATGGGLNLAVLNNGHDLLLTDILDRSEWSNVYWPSFDEKSGNIYFEALYIGEGHSAYIYSVNLRSKDLQPKKILPGRKPSLSPDGNLLVYYLHPNQLWLFNIKEQENRLIATDVPNSRPPVWISQFRLVYNDLNGKLIIFDTKTSDKETTGFGGVVAGALSPDGEKVLCVDVDGRKIYLYFIKTNKMGLIEESKHLSIGSSFVWSADGNSFLYTRQTWTNQLNLSEASDMFQYALAGKERRVFRNIALFGGFALSTEI